VEIDEHRDGIEHPQQLEEDQGVGHADSEHTKMGPVSGEHDKNNT